jgi:hypothetical protein
MYVSCSVKIKGCKDGQYFFIYKRRIACFGAQGGSKLLDHVLVKSSHLLSLQSVLGLEFETGLKRAVSVLWGWFFWLECV